MPSLRDILIKQAGVLSNIEGGLPAGLPRVSQAMTNVAVGFPINLNLPEPPGILGSVPGASSALSRTPTIIRGVEGSPSLNLERTSKEEPQVASPTQEATLRSDGLILS